MPRGTRASPGWPGTYQRPLSVRRDEWEDVCHRPRLQLREDHPHRPFPHKYDSVSKPFEPCHVIVFANFIPEHHKLSQDRWLVKTLQFLFFLKAVP